MTLDQITWQNVASLVGAVAGVWALIRTSRFKALDLRIPLRKDEADLRDLIDSLPGLMQRAVQSRNAIDGARGLYKSGVHVMFVEEMEAATKAIQDLTKMRPLDGQDHRGVSAADLESRIVEIHRVTVRAKALRDKFLASIATDDHERERLRDFQEARVRDSMRK
jgi:hypothetical protein